MSGVTLTVRHPPRQGLDLSPLLPERLAGLDAAAVGAIELACGNGKLRVDTVFEVEAGDAAELRIRNRGARLDFVGHGMASGRIAIEGEAGAYAGLAMTGGHLVVQGNAGAYAGAAMRAGIVEIAGNVGDFLGGGLPGERRGMTGGLILVRGDAGDRAGDRQRRGTILIEGRAGDYLGARMVAGTAIVLGSEVGRYPGFAMKRGTILLLGGARRLLPTFADCGSHELGFVPLLVAALRSHSTRLAEALPRLSQVRRLVGDAAAGGKGEILVASG